MILSFEQFTKANNELEKIIHDCDKQNIEAELKRNLDDIPNKKKRNYLDHLSSLFLNVLLNRVDELGQHAKDKSIEARRVISEIKNSL